MSRRPGSRAAVLAALAAAALLAAGCTGDREPGSAPAPGGGAQAVVTGSCPALGRQSTAAAALPDLELPCLGGPEAAPIALRRLTGTATVINLWASWCVPCREELPALARLHQAAAGRLRVVGVASEDRTAAAQAFAADRRLPFASLDDRDGRLSRALRGRGLPMTVLVTADGTVAAVHQGPLTDRTLRTLVRDELGVDVG